MSTSTSQFNYDALNYGNYNSAPVGRLTAGVCRNDNNAPVLEAAWAEWKDRSSPFVTPITSPEIWHEQFVAAHSLPEAEREKRLTQLYLDFINIATSFGRIIV